MSLRAKNLDKQATSRALHLVEIKGLSQTSVKMLSIPAPTKTSSYMEVNASICQHLRLQDSTLALPILHVGHLELKILSSLKQMTLTKWYTGSKATDEKATGSLFVSCLFVGEKVAFLSAQKATMKIIFFVMK